MEALLTNALDFSNYKQTLAIQRKTLKERIDAKLTFGHNGGIFKIDQTLISFVQFLISQERTAKVPLIDSNENPILIEDLISFRDEVLDRYFTATYEYHEEYEKLKKSRTVETLVDL
jgi:hypothetical protein